VISVFGLQALVTLLTVAFFGVVGAILLIGHPELASGLQIDTRIDLTDLIGTIGSLASGAFTVVGIVMLRRSRLRAYRAFEFALLIDLLLVQPYSLLVSQFGALSGVITDLLLLAVVRYLLNQERALLLHEG
jgi:hypothetical protein